MWGWYVKISDDAGVMWSDVGVMWDDMEVMWDDLGVMCLMLLVIM